MSKPMSLLFALTAVALMIGAGISLSYRLPWLALVLVVCMVLQVGAGFIVKAKMNKKQ